MKTIIILLSMALLINPTDIDFGTESDGADWRVINDGVMGGLSKGEMSVSKKAISLKGNVSLENNGGFSSLKGPFTLQDLSAYTHIEVRYRLEGQTMGLTMETSRQWYEPYFKYVLPPAEKWTTTKIEISAFEQYRVGRKTGSKITASELAQILRLGFITSSKKAGPFNFEVDYLRFY